MVNPPPPASTTTVVEIKDVWKGYYLEAKNRPKTLKSALVSRFGYRGSRDKYWALQGVNLKIPQGRTVGIIGNNGAGKSTLLRLISGLSRPTRGKITRQGKLGSLLELGAGFNTEFTGRENVITGSILAGLTRLEAEASLEKVVAFAELQDFIDSPLRTYSSGMFVRLAFSTEINLDPDILLVDEVLAVGDLAFQKKCLNYIAQMKQKGKTIIVVSHSMDHVQSICDEVVWLEHGRVRAQGSAKEVIARYKNRIFETLDQLEITPKTKEPALQSALKPGPGETGPVAVEGDLAGASATGPSGPDRDLRRGNPPITLKSVTLLNDLGQPVNTIMSGDPVVLQVLYHAFEPVQPIFMVGLSSTADENCYEVSSEQDGVVFGNLEGEGSFNLYLGSLPLVRGSYKFWIGIYSQDWKQSYDYRPDVGELYVEGATTGSGTVYIAHRWQV